MQRPATVTLFNTGTPRAKAANRIMQEAWYISPMCPTAPYEYFLVVSGLSYVHNHINPYVYQYYRGVGIPVGDIDVSIDRQEGLCGMQTLVFLTLMRMVGVQARTVQVYSEDGFGGNNHVFAEVKIGDRWVLMDLTSCTFFRNPSFPTSIWELLSFSEARALPSFRNYSISDPASLVNQAYTQSGYDLLYYIISPTEDIVRSGTGTINLYPTGNNYPFTNIPNYIGKYWFTWDDCYGEITYQLRNIIGATSLHYVVFAAGGTGNIKLIAKGVEVVVPFIIGEKVVSLAGLDLSEGLTMKAVPYVGDIYYPLFSTIEKRI